jgi:ABC-type transport system substrate-binding protein
MGTLIDAKTEKAAEGAITKVDDHTVKLKTSASDITIIPGMADYPACIVHRDFDKNPDMLKTPGTGPFEIVSYEVGSKAVVKRRENFTWWGGEPYLDGIEFIDYGGEQNATVSALEAGEIDANYQTTGETPTSRTSHSRTSACATHCNSPQTMRSFCNWATTMPARLVKITMSAPFTPSTPKSRRCRAISQRPRP